jgi:hypothetical protein
MCCENLRSIFLCAAPAIELRLHYSGTPRKLETWAPSLRIALVGLAEGVVTLRLASEQTNSVLLGATGGPTS